MGFCLIVLMIVVRHSVVGVLGQQILTILSREGVLPFANYYNPILAIPFRPHPGIRVPFSAWVL